MAHIKNRDVLLMAFTSVMLGTIVILSWYASRMMIFGGSGSSRRDSGGGAGQGIIMLIALLLVVLAPLFAQLIYFAISRKREYLADASGASFTRYPEGLASALEKIAFYRTAKNSESGNCSHVHHESISDKRESGLPILPVLTLLSRIVYVFYVRWVAPVLLITIRHTVKYTAAAVFFPLPRWPLPLKYRSSEHIEN